MLTIRGKESGFSLVELALVMAFAGIVLASTLQAYTIYSKKRVWDDTDTNLRVLNDAMAKFHNDHDRYPCPTDPSLPETDVNFGKEVCPPTGAPAVGACAGGICRAGGRDADGDTAPDPILIGSIPFITMGVAAKVTLDGYDRKITYAVTEGLTSAATFDTRNGALEVFDAKLGLSAFRDPATNAEFPWTGHLVLLSHGNDGKGGYTTAGVRRNCTAGAADTENCDNDGYFVRSGWGLVPGSAAFYDDIIQYRVSEISSLWSYVPGGTDSIYNKNPGFIGIGTDTPTQRLDVNGNVKAVDVLAGQLCDAAGTNCFPTEAIAGSADIIKCPTNRAMTGIRNSAAECDAMPVPVVGITPGTCADPANPYVIGIAADGSIICGP